MALTKAELEEIRATVVSAFAEHGCRFTVTDEEARKLSQVAAMFSELGDGDVGQGVMEVRDNHIFIQKRRIDLEPVYAENHAFVLSLRQGVDSARAASIKVLVGSLITAILTGLVLLFKSGKIDQVIK